MKWTSQLNRSVVLTCGLALGLATAAVAQKPASTSSSHHRMTNSSAMAAKPKPNSFHGVAAKLNTTPEALQTAYAAARQENPKLTHGQFVAANMVAFNLGSKNPNITTEAILAGLKNGKSLGQTLQALGLSAKEAQDAQRQADRDAKAAS